LENFLDFGHKEDVRVRFAHIEHGLWTEMWGTIAVKVMHLPHEGMPASPYWCLLKEDWESKYLKHCWTCHALSSSLLESLHGCHHCLDHKWNPRKSFVLLEHHIKRG
jgi:hypothetical protein